MVENKKELVDSPDYPIELDETNFDKALEKYNFLVVDCWAVWCMPCLMVAPIIENLAKKYKGEITFGKVNVDKAPSIAEKFGIMAIPTLIIFKNGKKIDEVVGALPENMLEEKLKFYKEK